MRNATSIGYALGTTAAIALIAGCSGANSQIAPTGSSNSVQSSVVRTRGSSLRPLVYVADYPNNAITVFDRNASVVGKITNGLYHPVGILVDGSHNIWVVNEHFSNVVEFTRGGTTPIKTLDDSVELPVDVTICPNGTIYVSNFDTLNSDSGNISVYANGSTSPTGSLSYPGEYYNYYLTCDANNNVFTTMYIVATGIVVEYPGGRQSAATRLPIYLGLPGGIKIDQAGNLLVGDQAAHRVTEYTEAGVPTGNSITTGSDDWHDIAVTPNGQVVLGADTTARVGDAVLFPGGTHLRTYKNHFRRPSGVAFDPGQGP